MNEQLKADLENRFTYHRPTTQAAEIFVEFRKRCLDLALFVAQNVPAGREQAVAITKLEEAMMWGNAGIARTQPKA